MAYTQYNDYSERDKDSMMVDKLQGLNDNTDQVEAKLGKIDTNTDAVEAKLDILHADLQELIRLVTPKQ